MSLATLLRMWPGNNGQVSHEHLVLVDWRRNGGLVLPVEGGLVDQVTAVDFIDNLHNPWQEAFNHVDWPTFHVSAKMVVGIGSRFLTMFQACPLGCCSFVDQNPHQLE